MGPLCDLIALGLFESLDLTWNGTPADWNPLNVHWLHLYSDKDYKIVTVTILSSSHGMLTALYLRRPLPFRDRTTRALISVPSWTRKPPVPSISKDLFLTNFSALATYFFPWWTRYSPQQEVSFHLTHRVPSWYPTRANGYFLSASEANNLALECQIFTWIADYGSSAFTHWHSLTDEAFRHPFPTASTNWTCNRVTASSTCPLLR
jgi:hypothetical protein